MPRFTTRLLAPLLAVPLLACGDASPSQTHDPETATSTAAAGTDPAVTGAASAEATTADDSPTACTTVPAPAGMRCIEGGTFGSPTEHVIATFWLDETEVTQAAYRACVAAGACTPPQTDYDPIWATICNWDEPGREDHPVNCVDWAQADAYCAWVDKRLPDEWEWEWAARGREEGRPYPWGQQLASCARAVMLEQLMEQGCDAGITAPVGSKPEGASRDGVLDLIGNVREWTSSWRDDSQEYRITRGGGMLSKVIVELRVDNRYAVPPEIVADNLGFRCAQSPPL